MNSTPEFLDKATSLTEQFIGQLPSTHNKALAGKTQARGA